MADAESTHVPAPDATVEPNRPRRIQRKRTRGWKMPPNTVYVGRPTKWGNPLDVNLVVGRTLADVMQFYREYITEAIRNYNPSCTQQYRGLNIKELRGKDLACWCPLDRPCHADVLLELANRGAE